MLNLDVVLGLEDPALVTRWFVHFPDTNDPFDCIAERIEVPTPKLAPKPRHGQGKTYYYPDFEEIDAVSITLYEFHDYRTSKYLNGLANKVRDERGNYGVPDGPNGYKKIIHTHLYQQGQNQPVVRVELQGAWITDRGMISLNYEESTGRVMLTTQFQIDRAKFNFT